MFGLTPQEIERVCAQDADVFSRFYTQSVNIFFRYIKAHYFMEDPEIHDLLSEFYLKCRKNLHKYNPEYAFETFVWTIFRNFIKDHFKKIKETYPDADVLEDLAGGSDEDEALEILEQSYAFEQIKDGLAALDELSQTMISLRFIEEKTYEEISVMLDCSVETCRKRLSRALKKLKQNINNKK